jgi:hypothetical protein
MSLYFFVPDNICSYPFSYFSLLKMSSTGLPETVENMQWPLAQLCL